MRLLAIVPSTYDTSPGQRFRLEQWEPRLRARGVTITYRPFEDAALHDALYQSGHLRSKAAGVARGFARRWSTLRSVREHDVVYVFREAALLGPPIFERLIARSRVPMVFDFDDAVFVPYRSPANGYLSYLKFAGKTKTICRLATHVVAGNAYLAEYARRFTPHVTVIPTTIDTEKYLPGGRRESAVPIPRLDG